MRPGKWTTQSSHPARRESQRVGKDCCLEAGVEEHASALRAASGEAAAFLTGGRLPWAPSIPVLASSVLLRPG